MRRFAILSYLKAVEQIFHQMITQIKILQTVDYSCCLAVETYKYVKVVLVEINQDMKKIRKKEKTVREIK